ncbi:asparagine-linked glycosylation protein [Linderina pennispora]|nr:asparagine-linked glycosylation protein [Linderina pennispora]
MTNSSWTHGHIVKLFGKPKMTRVVYPPCDTKALVEFPTSNRMPFVVSLAQFRPEKNHKTQVEAFAKFLDSNTGLKLPTTSVAPTPESLLSSARQYEASGTKPDIAQYPMMIMMGGARNIEDEARAEELRQLAKRLGIERQVHVIVNAPWSQVLEWLKFGRVGMHTMKDEHFGINVVEMLAAGLLTVGHDSAGPKLDIITPAVRISEDGEPEVPSEQDAKAFLGSADSEEEKTFPVGMVAKSADEFAKMIQLGLGMSEVTASAMRKAARHAAATEFSEAAFVAGFYKRFNPVIRWLDYQRSDEDDDDEYE